MATIKGAPAGTTGPERNLHLDHDSAREAIAEGRTAIEQEVGDRAGGLVREARARLDDARDWAADAYAAGSRRAGAYGRQVGDGLSDGRQAVVGFTNENPLLIGVVGLAAGLLLGVLLPRTRHEDRAMGDLSDGVREQGWRYAREAAGRGRAYIDDALSAVDEAVPPPRPDAGGQRNGPSGRYQNH